MATEGFDIPNCPPGDGDTIMLLEWDGLKVAGVRYNSRHGNTEDKLIYFARF
jgi:hypothetical protein